MIRFTLSLFAGISILGLLVSCEKPVDLNIGRSKSQLVIVSNFTPSQPIVVQVSKTRSPTSTEDSVYVENATVSLYQGAKLLEVLELVSGPTDQPPYYTTRQTTPLVGVTYTIHAQAPDFEPISATSSVPIPTAIRSLRLSDLTISSASGGRTDYRYDVSIVFNDPAEGKNYYHLNFYQQILEYRSAAGDTLITDASLRKIVFSSELDDNSLIAYFQGGVLFDDKNFNGNPISYSFPLQVNINPRKELIGKMFAELRTVSEEYFLFHNSLSRQQTNSTSPLKEPVMVYANIENGQGIFAGYNASVDSVSLQR